MADVGPAPGNSPFLKQLASSSSRTRSEALDHLRQYLRTRATFSHIELLKLWKGLFYCVWHSDRPKAQQALARDLAGLTHVLRDDVTTEQWLRTFWETMAREWEGIPSLRMDKFLYCCRCYVNAGFEWARRGAWDAEKMHTINSIMQDLPLSTEYEQKQMTNGLRLHVLDVYVDELEKCQDDGAEMPLEVLLQPVRRLQQQTKDKAILNRAKQALADERLQALANGSMSTEGTMADGAASAQKDEDEDNEDEDEDEWTGIDEG